MCYYCVKRFGPWSTLRKNPKFADTDHFGIAYNKNLCGYCYSAVLKLQTLWRKRAWHRRYKAAQAFLVLYKKIGLHPP